MSQYGDNKISSNNQIIENNKTFQIDNLKSGKIHPPSKNSNKNLTKFRMIGNYLS